MNRTVRIRPRIGFFHGLHALLLAVVVVPTAFMVGVAACANRVLPGELSLAAYQPRLTTEIYSTEVQPNGT